MKETAQYMYPYHITINQHDNIEMASEEMKFIFYKFLSLAAMEFIKISSAAHDEKFVKMTTFSFQWRRCDGSLTIHTRHWLQCMTGSGVELRTRVGFLTLSNPGPLVDLRRMEYLHCVTTCIRTQSHEDAMALSALMALCKGNHQSPVDYFHKQPVR